MVTLNKLKYAININLTTLDTTLINNNKQIQTKFEMQRREFWERQFTFFPL